MIEFIYKRIIKAFNENGVDGGKKKYREYFASGKNAKWKKGVDSELKKNYHENLIN